MDRAKRTMGQEPLSSSPASEINFAVDPKSALGTRFIAATTGIVDRRLGTHDLPVGEVGRNPASPFPLETGKRTLETGPSYER